MLVTRMEQAGWVLRRFDAVDARLRRLYLAPPGEALALQGQAIQSEVVAAMVSACSPAEIKTIAEAMQRASVELEALLQQPGVD